MTFQIVTAIITTLMTGFVSYLFYKFQKYEERRISAVEKLERERQEQEQALMTGMLALCRDRIIQGYRFFKRQGSISMQDLETMTKSYNAYHALGGNGTITEVYEKCCRLPLKEE